MNKIIVAVIVVAIVAFVGQYYLRMSRATAPVKTTPQATSTPSQTSSTEPTASESGAAMESTQKTITVNSGSFYFDPKEIKVKKGTKIKLTLKNKEGMHDWVIKELDVKTKILSAGEEDTIEFTADKTGTFEYYCSVGNHRQMGMVGNLIVE